MAEIALNGGAGWIEGNADWTEVSVFDHAGELTATIAKPLADSLLGSTLGFVVADGVPYYDSTDVQGDDAVLTVTGDQPYLGDLPAANSDTWTAP